MTSADATLEDRTVENTTRVSETISQNAFINISPCIFEKTDAIVLLDLSEEKHEKANST